jgi:hypothetical protein
MKTVHPTIIISFVPGSCTGVWQPLDVSIQRVLKQSMKRSAHKDIIDKTMAHLDSGTPASTFKLDITIGTLCDQSVGWIMNAYDDINKKDLILKVSIFFVHHASYYGYSDSPFFIYTAFELCAVGNVMFHKCLTPKSITIRSYKQQK